MSCFQTVILSLPQEDADLLQHLADERRVTQVAITREALQLLDKKRSVDRIFETPRRDALSEGLQSLLENSVDTVRSRRADP
jgi:predicted transcriptional regulator